MDDGSDWLIWLDVEDTPMWNLWVEKRQGLSEPRLGIEPSASANGLNDIEVADEKEY